MDVYRYATFFLFLWKNSNSIQGSDLASSGLPNGVSLLEGQACGMHDNVLGIENSISSLEECTGLCQDDDDCKYATFYGQNSFPFSETCIMFRSCDDIVDCVDCTTEDSTCKEVSCTTSVGVESRIGDNLVSFIPDLEDENECRTQCRNNSDCLFFTYHDLHDLSFSRACFLLSSLKAPIKTCHNCKTGPKTCDYTCSLLHEDGGSMKSLKLTEPDIVNNVTAVSLGTSCQLSVVIVGGGGHGNNGAAGGSGYVWWNVTSIVGVLNFEATVGNGMEFTTVTVDQQEWLKVAPGRDGLTYDGGDGYSGGGGSGFDGDGRGGYDGSDGGNSYGHDHNGGTGSGIDVRTIPAGVFSLS